MTGKQMNDKEKKEQSRVKIIIRIGGVATAVILSVLVLFFGKHDIVLSTDGEAPIDSVFEMMDGDLDYGGYHQSDLAVDRKTEGESVNGDSADKSQENSGSGPDTDNTGRNNGTEEAPLILEDEDFSYRVIDGKAAIVTAFDSEAERLQFPASIKGYPVTVVGEYICQNFSNLKEVVLPECIEDISYNAFDNCVKLETINLPDGLSRIQECAFWNCQSLIRISLPTNLQTLEAYSFYGCDNLTELVLSKTEGLAEAFDLTNINKITIREGITALAESAFEHCTSLDEIHLPTTLTNIRPYAFYDCTALQQIAIPDAVVSIGENAFEGCTSLMELTLPEGLILLSEYAFYDCSSLKQINIPDGVTQIGTSVFDNCDQVVLSVTTDSVGEQYALTNEIPYEIRQ